MISVLIPLYNRDAHMLVEMLSRQAAALPQKVEIIVIDDCSDTRFQELNADLDSLLYVRYIKAAQNNGRIKIRQLLASAASFEWLIFLDCDSRILSDQFLLLYYKQVALSPDVVMGGRIYSPDRPEDCRYRLHWKYGSVREKTSANGRGRPQGFMTSNFLIRKPLFEKLRFNSDWKGYGYEDTWMGMQLEQISATVKYIDNPVLHDGIEESPAFISKAEMALQNLGLLSRVVSPELLKRHIKLYSYFHWLRSLRMLWVVGIVFRAMRQVIMKNLLSCKPSLFFFDLYRLHYFIVLAGHPAQSTK